MRARRTATVLRAHGSAPGERVNVHLTNRPEFYDLVHGNAQYYSSVYGERRNLSIGRLTISARVRVDDDQLLVAGEPGWTLMSGYLDDPEATAAVLRDGASVDGDELIAWCAERLAKFKVPARVEFVSELPRAPVGKIQKHLIRAGSAQLAG